MIFRHISLNLIFIYYLIFNILILLKHFIINKIINISLKLKKNNKLI